MTCSIHDPVYKQATAICAKISLDFEQELIKYAKDGYVYVSPQCIILAEIQDDAWFIQLAVGVNCLPRFLELMPFELPYVAWERGLRPGGKKVRCKLETLRRLL